MRENKAGLIILVLILVVIILLGVISYAFIIKPAINRYVVGTQTEGVNYALGFIVQQVQQNGYVDIPVGNQTLRLIPAQPIAPSESGISSLS